MIDYNSSDFTLTAYESLLLLAKKKFIFKKYTDDRQGDDFIFWRHDVDFSLDQALVLAKIEQQQGISATYFVHLHNDFYNALDLKSYHIILQILSLGHQIGLHFDLSYYKIQSISELESWLIFEKSIIERLLQIKVSVFSFHNTNAQSMTYEDDSYAGMINTYSHYFKQEIAYCSDSNGYWRFRSLSDVLTDESISRLQVLTHPGWWTEQSLMPREKVVRYAARRYEHTITIYDELLLSSDRLNIR